MRSYVILVQAQLKLFLRKPLALFFIVVFPAIYLGFYQFLPMGMTLFLAQIMDTSTFKCPLYLVQFF
jgi:hypothetical protein